MKHVLPTDGELVQGMLAGQQSAFQQFFKIYFPRIYRFALPRVNGDVEACQDVVQATLSKAVRNLAGFRGEATLFSWLGQICRRQIIDHLRVNRRHSERVVLIDDSPEVRAALESVEAPLESEPQCQYGAAETRQLVQSILDRLPSRYGDVLEWKYVEGCSVEEIAGRLHLGHIAAQSLLARARIAFREAIETIFGSTTDEVLLAMREGKQGV